MTQTVDRCGTRGSPVVIKSSGEYRPACVLSPSELDVIADALERVIRSRPAQPPPMEWLVRCSAALAIVRSVQHGRA